MQRLHCLTISAAPELAEQAAAALASICPYGWEEKASGAGCDFIIYGEDEELLKGAARKIDALFPGIPAQLALVEIPDPLEAWKEFFKPVICGSRFVALPPWLANDPWPGRQKIVINPKSAFGTGHHASTALCLTALSRLLDAGALRPGMRFLDLGCGSGILGIAAALCGLAGLGIDIDPIAVSNARENRELNQAAALDLAEGSLAEVQSGANDLVMANILAGPLIELAPDLRAALKPGGCLILSGILAAQGDAVADAYRALGAPERLADGEWLALVWGQA